jgi:PAT family beta-lactamase induction signal transducer AmpG
MNRRGRIFGCVTLLGFSSGLPLALTGATLQAWMKTENVDLTTIGLFALVALPYSFKFAWSPLMDRYNLPFLGRRRGWVLLTQLALALGFAAMAELSPSRMPKAMALAAFVVTFFAASQDIVIDAYKTDILDEKERGLGAGVANAGYRVAMLTSGALALILSDRISWHAIYLLMSGAMSIGVVGTLLAPEPKTPPKPPRNLTDAFVLPFTEFFRRPGALEVLVFAVLYRLDVVVATALTTPFMMDLGFTKTDIGAVSKGLGLAATVVGTLAGGALMTRWSMKKALWIFGWFQGVSGLAFTLLARAGHDFPLMMASITLENFCSGLGTAAYSAFLMSLCDARYTATQFALLTSLMALSRTLGAAPTGWVATHVGWQTYYVVSLFAGVPALLMLTRYSRWATRGHVATA